MRSKAEIRNPLVALPAFRAMAALPPDAKQAVELLLFELAADARARAELSWRKNKAPMAAYWKAVSVYARHARLGLK